MHARSRHPRGVRPVIEHRKVYVRASIIVSLGREPSRVASRACSRTRNTAGDDGTCGNQQKIRSGGATVTLRPPGQKDPHAGTAFRAVPNLHCAALIADKAFHHREAKPGPASLATDEAAYAM
jgi:hypothetical protein